MRAPPITRPFAAHEWPLLRELRLAALADAPSAFRRTLAEEEPRPDAEWARMLATTVASASEISLRAELDGRAVGLAYARIEPGGATAQLFSMWVAPAARRAGAGRALVEAAAAWARARGARRLRLEVSDGNVPAQRLYAACGFRPTGERATLRPDADHGAHTLERDLERDPGSGASPAPDVQALVSGPFGRGTTRQLEQLRRARDAGMPRLGWKIGLNVPEVQRRLGLPHAGLGWLDGRRRLESGAAIAPSPDARLHVEPAIALRVARDVAPGASPAEARACLDALHPALEVVDYALPAGDLDAVVAGSMFHHATVLGAAASPRSTLHPGGGLPALRAGERQADPPRAELVPADPGALLAFVAAYLAAFGESLRAGDLVLSGSFTERALPLAPGEEAVADFGTLGSVRVRAAT